MKVGGSIRAFCYVGQASLYTTPLEYAYSVILMKRSKTHSGLPAGCFSYRCRNCVDMIRALIFLFTSSQVKLHVVVIV